MAKVAAWDRRGRVRLVPLQDGVEAGRLLGGMDETARMASWHLVGPGGEVRSAGDGVAPLLRLLPRGRAPAWLAGALGPVTRAAYGFVARHRSALGRALGRRARERAEARLRARDGHDGGSTAADPPCARGA